MDLSTNELRNIQLCELKCLKEIKRTCEKNSIPYFLIGGTLIGAVRHKGFIPWDVDIDIAMPRSDYEKFIEIANNELNSKHECQTYKTHKNFTSPHILIVLKNSSIIFNSDLINKTVVTGKEETCISVTLAGTTALLKWAQPVNAEFPIVVTPSGILASYNPLRANA